jgi:hypothetical protein
MEVTMLNKHIQQIVKAKAAINLLQNNISCLSNYQDIQNELNLFHQLYSKDANDKNQNPNKTIIGFINYLKSDEEERNLKSILKKAKVKKLSFKKSYKDYIPEYLILKQRGYSNKAISTYSSKHFKIKVSKETIRKLLNNLRDNEDAVT